MRARSREDEEEQQNALVVPLTAHYDDPNSQGPFDRDTATSYPLGHDLEDVDEWPWSVQVVAVAGCLCLLFLVALAALRFLLAGVSVRMINFGWD